MFLSLFGGCEAEEITHYIAEVFENLALKAMSIYSVINWHFVLSRTQRDCDSGTETSSVKQAEQKMTARVNLPK